MSKTHVTDEGLEHLASLKSLKNLALVGTKVTDNGLKYLKELKDLQYLSLFETNVTEAGVTALQKALPRVGIVRLSKNGK